MHAAQHLDLLRAACGARAQETLKKNDTRHQGTLCALWCSCISYVAQSFRRTRGGRIQTSGFEVRCTQ